MVRPLKLGAGESGLWTRGRHQAAQLVTGGSPYERIGYLTQTMRAISAEGSRILPGALGCSFTLLTSSCMIDHLDFGWTLFWSWALASGRHKCEDIQICWSFFLLEFLRGGVALSPYEVRGNGHLGYTCRHPLSIEQGNLSHYRPCSPLTRVVRARIRRRLNFMLTVSREGTVCRSTPGSNFSISILDLGLGPCGFDVCVEASVPKDPK